MPLAIFGITNDGLNLAVSLFVLMLVVVWLALIVYTFLDARRRIDDPVLVACATAASFFPYIGTIVYVILRPPEYIEDARERDLEMKAAELRVRQLAELSCPNCEFPVEKNYLRCPNCQRRLKDPCPTCSKPVDPRWALCPYCEASLPAAARARRRPDGEQEKQAAGRAAARRSPAPRPPEPAGRPQAEPGGRPEPVARPQAEAGPGPDAEKAPAAKPRRRSRKAAAAGRSGDGPAKPKASGRSGRAPKARDQQARESKPAAGKPAAVQDATEEADTPEPQSEES
ncbi:MAG: zinc ribbon domain-containing protein [Solirubrobacterales bacterium]